MALACGYRHAGHFSSDFRKRFGLTPSAVRWQGRREREREGGGEGQTSTGALWSREPWAPLSPALPH
ncbi:MAG: AraC family transcriptional regulator [Cyanobium sp.]